MVDSRHDGKKMDIAQPSSATCHNSTEPDEHDEE